MTTYGTAVPDLSVRYRQAELMDDPALDAGRHIRALTALKRINQVSFAATRVWAEVLRLSARVEGPIRVLDIACGGGDVLHGLGRRALRAGVPVELHGCDLSPVALEQTRHGAESGVLVDAFELDALRDEIPSGYHLITSGLFLHHLERDDAVALLARMAEATAHSLLVQDLRRTSLGYLFAWVGLHTLTGSDVARVDGLRSVRAAFTTDEAVAMCAEAELSDARIERGWPQRFVLQWVKTDQWSKTERGGVR